MLDDNFTCKLPDYPIRANSGAGGILEDNTILVCGGYLPYEEKATDKCFKLAEDKSWQLAGRLENRLLGIGTGSVVFNDKLLITGGKTLSPEIRVESTYMIGTTSKEPLKDMWLGLSHHCNVKLNNSHVLVTGGQYDEEGKTHSTPTTFILNLIDNVWNFGPHLRDFRSAHGCIKMLIGERPFIWVVGGFGRDVPNVSTEYLDVSNLDEGWKQGPELQSLEIIGVNPVLVSSEDLKTVYVTGSYLTLDESNDKIRQLHCSGSTPDTCEFKIAASNVKVDTIGHIALPITNDLAAKLCA